MNASIAPVERGRRRRIAVVGSGITGAACAWALNETAEVTLFEAEALPGGHTATVDIDYGGRRVPVDTGFIVYNELNYPELTSLFAHLGVATHESDMSFSLSLDGGRMEWGGHNLRTMFARKRNTLSPRFLLMLREILRFNRQCVEDRDAGRLAGMTIGDYLAWRRFSAGLREDYLMPMAAAIWSTSRLKMLDFPAATFITFFENHRLIHDDRPKWRTVSGGARNYHNRLIAPLGERLRLGAPVEAIFRDASGAMVWSRGVAERFDDVVLATHTDQTLCMLGDGASHTEISILSAIDYRSNRVVLHRDPRLMPKRRAAWSAWNYMRSRGDEHHPVSVTYWMNRLQAIDPAMPLFVSLNPHEEPRQELVFGEWRFDHPQFDAAALSAQARLDEVQGVRHTWFAGAWCGYGFHEDGLRAGLDVAQALGAVVPWRTGAATPPKEVLAMAAE